MKELRVLGVYVENRVAEASAVQAILGTYGCNIKTRLGLHEVSEDNCAVDGLIILELAGTAKDQDALEAALRGCKGVRVQKMVF
jgi:hypothetical protein